VNLSGAEVPVDGEVLLASTPLVRDLLPPDAAVWLG
jgi:hypothetical protein